MNKIVNIFQLIIREITIKMLHIFKIQCKIITKLYLLNLLRGHIHNPHPVGELIIME
jgi:hypothetical protein